MDKFIPFTVKEQSDRSKPIQIGTFLVPVILLHRQKRIRRRKPFKTQKNPDPNFNDVEGDLDLIAGYISEGLA